MGEPGFWDDPEAAAKVNAEYARTQRRLETYKRLEADTADLDGLVELAEEDEDMRASSRRRSPRSSSASRRSRSSACSPATTTPATRS